MNQLMYQLSHKATISREIMRELYCNVIVGDTIEFTIYVLISYITYELIHTVFTTASYGKGKL